MAAGAVMIVPHIGVFYTSSDIHARDPRADGAQQLIADRAGERGQLIHGDRCIPAAAEYRRHIARRARHICHVGHAHIHAYEADLADPASVYEHVHPAGQRPVQAVGISGAHCGYFCLFIGNIGASVTYGCPFGGNF